MTSNAEIAKAMADNMTHAAVPLYGKKLRLPDRGAIIGIIKEFRRLLFPAYFGDAQLMALPPENYAALRYVTYILGARYLTTVREEKGGTYYVGVHDEVSARPRGYCQLVVSFDTDPKLCEILLGEVQKGIERLAAEAPSEQEVNEAMLYFRKVNAESRSKNLKSTSYWLNKMRAEYFDGVDLDKDNEALFTAVPPAEVRRLAREILAQGNRYTAVFTQE